MVTLELRKTHAYVLSFVLVLALAVTFSDAFGGSNPAIVGHSALELIVNSSSVVDNSLTGDDIDESTLVIGGGSSLTGAVIIVTPGDATTIQNAIDNLSSLGGGTVYLREGTYTIAGPINLTNNIALVGEGSASILQSTTNGIDVVTEQNAGFTENVRLKDFAIRAGSATGVDGVVFTDVAGLIEGLDIQGMQGSSISVNNPGGTLAKSMLIQRNKIIMATGTNGITATGGGNIQDDSSITVDSNVINSNATRGILCDHGVISSNEIVAGIGILADRDCLIIDNMISSNSGAGISVTGSPSTIIGNDIEVADDEGILNSAGGATESIIANNIVRLYSSGAGNHAGIAVTANSAISVITGNIVNDGQAGAGGINVSGDTVISNNYVQPILGFAIAVDSGPNGVISDNVVEDGGIWAAGINEGTISGNSFIGSGNSDLNITGSTQFTVTGNWIRGDLDATGSGTCALTGNVVVGTIFPGTCLSTGNV